jgi:hypothetical protein
VNVDAFVETVAVPVEMGPNLALQLVRRKADQYPSGMAYGPRQLGSAGGRARGGP